MNSRIEAAESKFAEGYSCAQAVLFAFCDDLNLDKDIALKLSCGFGAGMGRRQEVCGAVSGGILALGMKYGRGLNEGPEAKDHTYRKVDEFMKLFADRYGSYYCRELLEGCDLQTETGAQLFRDNNLMQTVCAPCVRGAVELVESLMP